MRKDRVAALLFVNIDSLMMFLRDCGGYVNGSRPFTYRVGELSLTVANSGEGENTEKDINTLLSSVLKHIKMGWSIKLNVAFWGGIDDCCFIPRHEAGK
jgi:hypothetical protein